MWPHLETALVVTIGAGEGVIATWWQKPETSLNVLRCTGQPPTAKTGHQCSYAEGKDFNIVF